MNLIFAGKDIAGQIDYFENQGREMGIDLKIRNSFRPFVKFYLSIFGIPDLGFQERFYLFQQFLKKINGRVFIDAGCGIGEYSKFAAKFFPNVKIYSLDINKKLIDLNKKINSDPHINFLRADLTKKIPKIKQNVDAVWCLDVLEHIKNYKIAVDNLNKMIKKGGYLFIHVPLPDQRRWFGFFKSWTHEDHAHEGIKEKEIMGLLKNYKIIGKKGTFGALGSLLWETNILLFTKIPLVGAVFFPILRIIMLFDSIIPSKKYNCLSIFAQKNE